MGTVSAINANITSMSLQADAAGNLVFSASLERVPFCFPCKETLQRGGVLFTNSICVILSSRKSLYKQHLCRYGRAHPSYIFFGVKKIVFYSALEQYAPDERIDMVQMYQAGV